MVALIELLSRTAAAAGIAIAAVAAPGPAQGSAQQLLFPAPQQVGAGIGDYVVAADYDGDGRSDVAGAHTGTSGIAFLKGKGDGTFAGAPLLSPSPPPYQFDARAAADFDGDGALDLVEPDKLAFGQGDGLFGGFIELVWKSPDASLVVVESIDLGDVDADGNLDLAAAVSACVPTGGPGCQITFSVVVLLGSGDGSFAPAVSTTVAFNPKDLVLAELDGDSHLDVVIADGLALRALHGLGTGAFALPPTFELALAAQSLEGGDFDGDGETDLAVPRWNAKGVNVLLGTGTGSFGAPQLSDTGVGSAYAETADFDQDGRADLALGTHEAAAIFLRGKGDGSFFDPVVHPGKGGIPSVADLNGDSLPDLVSSTSSGFIVLLSTPSDGFVGPAGQLVRTTSTGYWWPSRGHVGDFDADGRADLAAGFMNLALGTKLAVALGLGDGKLAPVAETDIPGNLVAAGDLNGDGRLDLIAGGLEVTPLLGQVDGSFIEGASAYAGDDVRRGVAADLDGDGRIDVAVATKVSQAVSVLLNTGQAMLAAGVPYGVGKLYSSVGAGDFDADGALDLAAVETFQFNGVYVLRGNGDGTFGSPLSLPLPFAFDAVATDLDQDGNLDLAVGAATASAFLGDGAGGFGPAQPLAVSGSYGIALAFADLDGDGDLDLAMDRGGVGTPFAYSGGYTSVHLGSGALPFGPPAYFAAGGAPVPADLDLDGRIDLAAASDQPDSDPRFLYVRRNLAAAPAVQSIAGLPAASAGTAIVQGSGFDLTTEVLVDGQAAHASLIGPGQLQLALPPATPGFHDLALVGTFGSTTVPGGLPRWPTLAPSDAVLGQTLALELENGDHGLYAMAYSTGVLALPIALPGIYHAIALDPIVLLAVGAIPPGATAAVHAVPLPGDSSLQGLVLYLQGFAQQASLPVAPPQSFSNWASITLAAPPSGF